MEIIEKEVGEITRKEWVAYRWVEIESAFGDDGERVFRTNGRRTPEEAYNALEEWEMTAEDRGVEENLDTEKGPIQ